MRSLSAAGLLLRRLRSERGMILLVVVLVAVTSFLFSAAPRLFNRVADDALRTAVHAAPVAQRNLTMRLTTSLQPRDGDAVAVVRDFGEGQARQLPAAVRSLILDWTVRVTTVRFILPKPPSHETHLWLAYQDGLTDGTRLVAGRWPVDLGMPLSPDLGDQGQGGGSNGGEEPRPEPEPARIEVALARAEATEIGVAVGDRLAVVLDRTDPQLTRTGYRIMPLEIEVAGLYEPLDPSAEMWQGDTRLLQVEQHGTDDFPIAFATAYVAAEAYPDLWASGLPFNYEWRFRVDPARFEADQVAGLQVELRRMGLISSAAAAPDDTVSIVTGLPGILDRFVTARAASEAALSIAAIGPLGLAGGALAMTAILLVRRRAGTLALARGRGASGALVLGTQLLESILVAGGAAVVGFVVATAIVPGRPSPLSAELGTVVAVVAIVVLVGASWSIARRPLGELGRDDPPVLRVAPRRLVIELAIVVIAVAATLLLRQRGLTVGPAGSDARVDPFLASVPVLSGLAAGIVALRFYPLPVRALGWLAARRRDLVPVLGLRTVGRHPAAANLSLLVLLLTAAFGAFSSVIGTSVDRGQVTASYLDIGADYRLERIGIGGMTLDPAGIAGVEATAPGVVDPSADFTSTTNQRASTYVAAIDPLAYAEVTAGTPAAPGWPDAFLAAPSGAGVGTAENPIPALLSDRLPTGSAKLRIGDTFEMLVARETMTFQLVDQRAAFPGIVGLATFAVVPLTWVRAAVGDRAMPPTVIWLRGPRDVGAGLTALIDAERESARVVSRHDAYAALHDAPLVAAIGAGYGLALLAAVIYMVLTIVGALVLSAAGRTRDLAYLRTLGVSARQALALTVLEHAPPVLLALLPGIALGIGVAILAEPGMGLATFVGASGVPLVVDWPALAALIAALLGAVVLAVAAGTWLARRTSMADALRIGED
ncbi:MAG: ABC transporter permease [Chloroflexota bacterium]|nr:MAG: ABC transporter permease [Chloroflexota bacterium]